MIRGSQRIMKTRLRGINSLRPFSGELAAVSDQTVSYIR
jgi:hypothetical protein